MKWWFFAVVAIASPALADGNLSEMRENLVKLSVSPSEFVGKTVSVACPVEAADIDGIWCLVLNSQLLSVGRKHLDVAAKDASSYMDVLNHCPGPLGSNVSDDCLYQVEVKVKMLDGDIDLSAVTFHPLAK